LAQRSREQHDEEHETGQAYLQSEIEEQIVCVPGELVIRFPRQALAQQAAAAAAAEQRRDAVDEDAARAPINPE
jgi:hypothetical protein